MVIVKKIKIYPPTRECPLNDLVSLFNGISTFVGYLMPKPFSKKNSNDTI